MKKKTIFYMAGLFDAEGCFNVARSFKPTSNCYNYIAQIIFTNTNPKLMKWVVKHFGGVIKKRKIISGHKQAYDWKITNQKHALSFISIIYPYLIVKKKEAELMIQYYELNGKECPNVREQLFNKIKDLKWNRSSVTTEMLNASNAYLAGFFDGDGGISNPHMLYVTNTHKGVVNEFLFKFGGNYKEYKNNNPHQNDYYRWYICNENSVKNILLSFMPYLIDKKQKANNLLNNIRSKDTV